MGETLEFELGLLVRYGAWAAFPQLQMLRSLPPFVEGFPGADRAGGTERFVRILSSAIEDWEQESPLDAEAIGELLCLENRRGKRKLTGVDGLRERAGKVFNVGHDQFHRAIEKDLVGAFAAFLMSWHPQPVRDQPATMLRFDDVEATAKDLYRRLEANFRPDLIITMSGPGSFAACYMMQFNPRDVPVVMAVTFPRRKVLTGAERDFASAAKSYNWIHVKTEKWSVYAPGLIRELPSHYRIAIVDDRVITGETQSLMRSELESFGFEVCCAALFAGPSNSIEGLLVGRKIRGEFFMPWGTARGRE